VGRQPGREPPGKLRAAARDLYTQPPKADESLGLTAADFETAPVEVWPDNWVAVALFRGMATQWSVGMGGPIGLRYEALRELRLAWRIPAADWPELFDALQVMEGAALAQMRTGE